MLAKIWDRRSSNSLLVEMKMIQPLWKKVWWGFFFVVVVKLNILLPYALVITLPGIYSNEFKNYTHTKTCTQMFIVALFIIAKT